MNGVVCGVIIGGVLSIIATCFEQYLRRKAEKKWFIFQKQYDTYTSIVEFLYAILDFVNENTSQLGKIDDVYVTENLDKEWEKVVILKRNIYPQCYFLLSEDEIDKLEKMIGDISEMKCDQEKGSLKKEVEEYINKIKKENLQI